MKSSITQLLKYEIADHVKEMIFPTGANTYIGIGRPIRWGDAVDPELATEIEDVEDSTAYLNQVSRDLIAIKRVQAADTALVVPRVNWVTGIKYDEYSDTLQLFTHETTLYIGTGDVLANVITANTPNTFSGVALNDIISVGSESEKLEVIGLTSNTFTLNTAATTDGANISITLVSNTFPQFANNFYCRNSKDQVFKCLFNGNVVSSVEPTIDIDGQLPENPYILTGDGYKWKYLYTIPYGLKQKFFTTNWMPVVSDAAVTAGSVGGQIDMVFVTDGGTGYFLDNGESGNAASLAIVTVEGDGLGASMTANVSSGVITAINILNGGSGYTTATITVSDPDQLSNGNSAILVVSIPPSGGHGSNPVKELGCFAVMTAVDLDGTESDTLPVGSSTAPFDFRQITLLRDPLLANGAFAEGSVYRATTILALTDPGVSNYENDETVYIGTSLAAATFTATVVDWDTSNNYLYVNNLSGNVVVGSTLTGNTSSATTTVLGETAPDIELFTGDTLYIENRDKIVRDVDQTEQIRLILSF